MHGEIESQPEVAQNETHLTRRRFLQVSMIAGLATIGDDVKTACAQIVRNAQATPALNASKTRIDTMQMQYFSSSLIDETVKAWLKPYVANRLG